jgi:hypothetical protein
MLLYSFLYFAKTQARKKPATSRCGFNPSGEAGSFLSKRRYVLT